MRSLLCVLAVSVLAACGTGTDREALREQARREADPRALAYLLEAQQAVDDGLYHRALAFTDSAARHAPELADIAFMRGLILTAMRQYRPAMEAYEATLALDPAYPGVYLNLGNSAYLRGEPREALALYRKERGAAGTAAYRVRLGQVYEDLGLADSARWAYQQAVAADPDDPVAYMRLGQYYENEGALAEALACSRKGLALQPENLHYTYVVGTQLMRSGDLRGAAELLAKAAGGMPWHHGAHDHLGRTLAGLGQTEEGARYLARADTLRRREHEVRRWQQLVETVNDEPIYWVNLGNALHQAGRYDEAIEALTVAYALQPAWLELQNNIANLLLLRGDTAAALTRYRVLLQNDSTQADVWLNLGTVYALGGRYDEARTAWETALRLDPRHAEARHYLAHLPGAGPR